jgi:hypothetical protein
VAQLLKTQIVTQKISATSVLKQFIVAPIVRLQAMKKRENAQSATNGF